MAWRQTGNGDPVQWHIYAALGRDDLGDNFNIYDCHDTDYTNKNNSTIFFNYYDL